jgi:hypothetical protein
MLSVYILKQYWLKEGRLYHAVDTDNRLACCIRLGHSGPYHFQRICRPFGHRNCDGKTRA